MRKKRVHTTVRIPERLYDMVCALKPLFDGEFSDALIHILKAYEFSPDHMTQQDKIARMRFEVFMGEGKLRQLDKELTKLKKTQIIKKVGDE